jgi:hypothetical protein
VPIASICQAVCVRLVLLRRGLLVWLFLLGFVLQDELLNVIYWWRQVAGVLIGILLGLGNVTGIMGIIM